MKRAIICYRGDVDKVLCCAPPHYDTMRLEADVSELRRTRDRCVFNGFHSVPFDKQTCTWQTWLHVDPSVCVVEPSWAAMCLACLIIHQQLLLTHARKRKKNHWFQLNFFDFFFKSSCILVFYTRDGCQVFSVLDRKKICVSSVTVGCWLSRWVATNCLG